FAFLITSSCFTALLLVLFSFMRPPLRSAFFPYTTLFRSGPGRCGVRAIGDSSGVWRSPQADSGDRGRVDHHHGADQSDLGCQPEDRKSTRLNSSHVSISYAVFCLKKKNEQLTQMFYAGSA